MFTIEIFEGMPWGGGICQLGSATVMKFRQQVPYPEVGVNTINKKSFYLSPNPVLGSEITGNLSFIFDT